MTRTCCRCNATLDYEHGFASWWRSGEPERFLCHPNNHDLPDCYTQHTREQYSKPHYPRLAPPFDDVIPIPKES